MKWALVPLAIVVFTAVAMFDNQEIPVRLLLAAGFLALLPLVAMGLRSRGRRG